MRKVGLVLALGIALSGCAAVIDGTQQSISVNTSHGKRVMVSVDGKNIQTPATVSVKRGNPALKITTSDKSCASSTAVQRSIKTLFFLNFFLTSGLSSSTTDLASGAAWDYDNNVVVNCFTN
jgi:uncharacterized protein YceK